MKHFFATIWSSRRWKLALLVAGLAVLALAGGLAYAATSDAGSVINACAKTDTGQLRLNIGSGCLPSEQAVQFAQPQDTVRNATGFISNGQTASSPVLSGAGRLGTLSFTCSDLTYTTNTADTNTFADRVTFYSPEVADSPFLVRLDNSDHLTVPWSGNRWFQMLIEGMTGSQTQVTLTTITGYVEDFPQFSGCAYYGYLQTSDVRSQQTITP